MPLLPCPACRRHVRDAEPKCPFCAAPLEARVAAQPERVAPARLTRAALVFAGATLVGCPESTPPAAKTPGARPPAEARPAPADAGAQTAGGAAASPDAGPAPTTELKVATSARSPDEFRPLPPYGVAVQREPPPVAPPPAWSPLAVLRRHRAELLACFTSRQTLAATTLSLRVAGGRVTKVASTQGTPREQACLSAAMERLELDLDPGFVGYFEVPGRDLLGDPAAE